MSDGGLLAWKRQTIDEHRGPVASYGNLYRSLPDPPKDMHWVQDEKTKEWHLEKKEGDIIVDAKLVGDEESSSSAAEPFLMHPVQKSDTFQGICLKYKITPTELRQANSGFSGTNLFLAPNPLKIPNKGNYVEAKAVPVVLGQTPEQKLSELLNACTALSRSEAKCYLELNDWNTKEALLNAHEDGF